MLIAYYANGRSNRVQYRARHLSLISCWIENTCKKPSIFVDAVELTNSSIEKRVHLRQADLNRGLVEQAIYLLISIRKFQPPIYKIIPELLPSWKGIGVHYPKILEREKVKKRKKLESSASFSTKPFTEQLTRVKKTTMVMFSLLCSP